MPRKSAFHIGVDPAPSRKGSTVFSDDDASSVRMAPHQLSEFLNSPVPSGRSAVILAWDAPLTGVSLPECSDDQLQDNDLTQRHIERFFSTQRFGFKVKGTGVAVLGYSGCVHWTITRRLLGLPRVGPYDAPASELPYALVASNEKPRRAGKHVVEVHPALALWLLGRLHFKRAVKFQDAVTDYKKDAVSLSAVWRKLIGYADDRLDFPFRDYPAPQNDDQLDAFIAWLLLRLWDIGEAEVIGNGRTGALLLPKDRGGELREQFEAYCQEALPPIGEADDDSD